MKFKQQIPTFSQAQVVAISKVLGETDRGLKGVEIGHMLEICKIPDVSSDSTKWQRLHNAFCTFQNEHKVGNHVLKFINTAMDPALYVADPELFRHRQAGLNKALALCGFGVNDAGQVVKSAKAETLHEAVAAATRMKSELERRKVHPEVLRFCEAEILADNYFHAVVEAMKSVTARVRDLAKVDGDGATLVDKAFAFELPKLPILAINSLETSTKQSEQRGFTNLLKGLYGTVRNPLNHEAKIQWELSEQDAVDIMTTISLIQRKLDKAQRTHGS